jgi:hypothetical protein
MFIKKRGMNSFVRSCSVAGFGLFFFSWITAPVYAEPGYAGEWKKTRLYGHSYNSGDFTDEQYDWIRDHFEYFTIEKTHLRSIYGSPSHEQTSRLTATRLIEANPRCKPLMIYSVGGAYDHLFESEAQALIDHPDYFLYDTNGVTSSLNLANPDENDWYIETVNWNCDNSDLYGIFVDGFKGSYLSFPDNVRYMMDGMTGFRLANGFDFAPGGLTIRDFPDLLECTEGVFIDSFFRRRVISADAGVVLIDACLQVPNDYMMVCFGSYDGNSTAYGEWPITHEFTHAAYLIVANDNTYYRWVGDGDNWADSSLMTWYEDFDREMGEPLGAAVKNGYVYTRVFEQCTVTLDIENKTSSIEWGQDNGSTNQSPTAVSDSYVVPHNEATPILLSGTDPEGSNLTFRVVDLPAQGSLSGTAPNLTYTPTTDYTGSDHFTFSVSDGVYTSALATITLQINAADAVMTWATASNLSDPNDVSIHGTLVWAYSFGSSENAVVNGVTFAGESNPAGNADVTTDLTLSYTGYGNSLGTFSTLPAEYQSILASGAYRDAERATLTLGGLSLGSTYEVQFWINDSRNRVDMESKPRTATISDTSIVVDYNTAGASTNDGLGQFLIGTFTANASTVDIGLSTQAPQLNAIQLRLISEPASVVDSLRVAISGEGALSLSWTASFGVTYGVEATTNLLTGPWTDLANGLSGKDNLISITNRLTEVQQFFRVYLEE